jgi:predicted aspartyl protease
MPFTLCGFNDSESAVGADLLEQFGPTLYVDIGFDATYKPDGSTGDPDLAMKLVQALVDTGASTSCIDSQLAMNLNLPIVDQAMIAGVSGSQTVNMHLAQIFIRTLGITIYGQFAAVDLAAGGQTHSALIGRSFLRHFKMTYDGTTGTVIIADPDEVELPQLPFPGPDAKS